jgi:hypothetical protein
VIREACRCRNCMKHIIIIINARKSSQMSLSRSMYTILIYYYIIRYQLKTSYVNFGTREKKISFDQLKSNTPPRRNRVEIHSDTNSRVGTNSTKLLQLKTANYVYCARRLPKKK